MEDTAFMHLKLEGGVPGTLWCTQAAAGNYCGLRFRVFGDKGGLEWDQETPEILKFTPIGAATQIISRGTGAGMLPGAERMTRLPRAHGEGLSDAWCNMYIELAIAIEARRNGTILPKGMVDIPTVQDGLRGVRFVDAAADSHDADGGWMRC